MLGERLKGFALLGSGLAIAILLFLFVYYVLIGGASQWPVLTAWALFCAGAVAGGLAFLWWRDRV